MHVGSLGKYTFAGITAGKSLASIVFFGDLRASGHIIDTMGKTTIYRGKN